MFGPLTQVITAADGAVHLAPTAVAEAAGEGTPVAATPMSQIMVLQGGVPMAAAVIKGTTEMTSGGAGGNPNGLAANQLPGALLSISLVLMSHHLTDAGT